jgi:hypothetical protein
VPRWQVRREIAGREITFGPHQDGIKARPIVGDERKEHGIRLSFRSRAVACIVVNDPRLIVEETGDVALPHRRPHLRPAAGADTRKEQREHDERKSHHAPIHESFQLHPRHPGEQDEAARVTRTRCASLLLRASQRPISRNLVFERNRQSA